MALYAMVLVMVYTMVCNGMHTVGHKGSPYGIRMHMVCVCLRNGDGMHPHTVSIQPRDGLITGYLMLATPRSDDPEIGVITYLAI